MVNCQLNARSKMKENVTRSPAPTNCRRPHCTNSAIDSMSAVIRATSTPDLFRSKKANDCFCMCPNTRTRSSLRNPSPARLMNTYCWRDARYAAATTQMYMMTALRTTPRSSCRIPLSMPYLTITGPSSSPSVVIEENPIAAITVRLNGAAIRAARRMTCRASSVSRRSSSSIAFIAHISPRLRQASCLRVQTHRQADP